MTLNLRSVVVVAVLIVAAIAGWRWWSPNEEEKIAARLQELAAVASVVAEETPMERVTAVGRLRRYLAEDVVVEPPAGAPTVRGREDLLAMALGSRSANVKIELADVQVHLDGTETASAHLTATASRGAPQNDIMDAREVELSLRKLEGDWIIARIKVVETLERPR